MLPLCIQHMWLTILDTDTGLASATLWLMQKLYWWQSLSDCNGCCGRPAASAPAVQQAGETGVQRLCACWL